MRTPTATTAACVCLFILSGCLGIPMDKSAATDHELRDTTGTTAKVVNETKAAPAPMKWERFDPKTGAKTDSLEIPTEYRGKTETTTTSKTATTATDSTWFDQHVPLFVALIGTAVGVGLCFIVGLFIWRWFKSTVVGKATATASDMAWREASGMVGEFIHNIRSKTADAKDDKEIATLRGIEAEAARLQAKVNE